MDRGNATLKNPASHWTSKRLAPPLALVLSLALPAAASGPGTSAAPFLRLGFGARALGSGEAFVATADDASALYYNPAGLALATRPVDEFLVSHSLHFQDIGISQIGYVHKHYGVAATYLTVGDLEARTSETDQPDGTFGASDAAVSVSGGRFLGPVMVGASLKFIRQVIAQYSATGLALDLGAMYRVPGRPVSFGFTVANLGSDIRFVDEGFPLPTTYRLGAAAGNTASFPALVSVQVDFPRDSAPLYRAGLEYTGFGPFALRTGYLAAPKVQREALMGTGIGGTPTGLTEYFGFFAGFGFRFGRGSLDYALLPYGELGNSHRFSLGLRF